MADLAAALRDRYQLERELGHGGMATVYLAQDLRNRRKVALKVLRPDLAAVLGAERFLQEVETTANLHHPHILPLFDSGQADGFLYYAMPFVAGETLRDRLTREKQLPVEDAIRIAGEIADALDYAHRAGVLHRDIKPENILLHDGRALVADFGVALAMRNAGGSRLTETGLAIGTPQYMSPEQASAERELDARTDVYALGAVTYEMLAGEPPFTGNTTQAIIAKRMTEAPRPISVLRSAVPPVIESAVLRALERLPADRPASAAAFAAALRQPAPGGARVPLPAGTGSRWRNVALLLLLVGLLSTFAIQGLRPHAGPAEAATTRATIPLGRDLLLAQDGLPFDLSADGSEIVYSAVAEGKSQLYLRPIGSFQGAPIANTEGAQQPFFSPDGNWIAYVAEGKLQKVARAGGVPITLGDFSGRWYGGAWASDGTIYFALGDTALYRIPEGGGRVSAIPMSYHPTPADSELVPKPIRVLRWPRLLPGGKDALVSTTTGVALFNLATGRLRPLLRGNPGTGTNQAQYLPTGHIIYDVSEGRIRVVPFDLAHERVTGEPVSAFEAFRGPGSGAAQFAVSDNGTLIYVAGGFNRSLVLVDRYGRETPVGAPLRGYRFPRVSPDGQRIAVTIDPRPSQIWVVDLRGNQLTPVTSDSHHIKPVWDPKGERLVFNQGGGGLYWAPWQGGEEPEPVLRPKSPPMGEGYATDWRRDGRILIQSVRRGNRDIVTLAIGDTTVRPLLVTGASEFQGLVSPDGRCLLYTSDQSGSNEVYLRPFPGGGSSVVVSVGGGEDPRWSADSREVYYRHGSRIMAAAVRTAPLEVLGAPQELFAGPYDFSQEDNWDVTRDGRFVMVRADPATRGQFLAVFNWFTELRHASAAR